MTLNHGCLLIAALMAIAAVWAWYWSANYNPADGELRIMHEWPFANN